MSVVASERPTRATSHARRPGEGRDSESLPRYPKYKDSGVAWLGEVPAHWDLCGLRRRVAMNPSKSEIATLDRDLEVSFLPMEAVGEQGQLDLDRKRPIREVENGYTYFHDGDVTFAKITPCFENGKGALMRGLTNGVGFGTTELTVIRPKPELLYPEFLDWLLRTVEFRGQGEASMYGAGGQKRVPDDFVRDFRAAFPPAHEQVAIAAFLDRETARIDALVVEQEKLIALLTEKRRALISHAVTKGLDPNAPTKDSGIEWLGDVPAHWEVMQARHLSEFVTSGPRGWSDLVSDDGSVFIQSGDLDDALQIEFDTAKRVSIGGTAEAMRCRLMDGDVVVCITGAKTGNVAVCHFAPEPAYVNQHLCLIRPRANVLPSYLGLVLKSNIGQTQFELFQYGLKQGLSLENIRDMLVALPPTNEQRGITAYLDHAFRKHDALKAEAERAIALLKERRSALISAAVTGKIDVRVEAAEAAA